MQTLQKFRRFLGDDRASLSVEAVLVFPLLLWAYFGMFILFDGYRALASNIRASYTISDMLTRETNPVSPAYIEGLNDILDVLTQSPHRTVLRVTQVRYDADEDEHHFEWSYSTDGKDAITSGNFDSKIVPYLPPMHDEGRLVAVETWMAFVPFMNITLKPFYFENITVTRPRFACCVPFDDGTGVVGGGTQVSDGNDGGDGGGV